MRRLASQIKDLFDGIIKQSSSVSSPYCASQRCINQRLHSSSPDFVVTFIASQGTARTMAKRYPLPPIELVQRDSEVDYPTPTQDVISMIAPLGMVHQAPPLYRRRRCELTRGLHNALSKAKNLQNHPELGIQAGY